MTVGFYSLKSGVRDQANCMLKYEVFRMDDGGEAEEDRTTCAVWNEISGARLATMPEASKGVI